VLGIADPLRATAAAAVAALRARGLRVAMVTGDSEATARQIGRLIDIADIQAQVLPAAKADAVRRRQASGQTVAFVGDGINDAPALAQADVGIAVATGTEIAIEAADITLTRGDPGALLSAFEVATRTMRTIRANLFWAFFYNVLLIPLASGVFYPLWHIGMNPMFAGLAMGLSSIFVVTNSLRLRTVPVPRLAVQTASGHESGFVPAASADTIVAPAELPKEQKELCHEHDQARRQRHDLFALRDGRDSGATECLWGAICASQLGTRGGYGRRNRRCAAPDTGH